MNKIHSRQTAFLLGALLLTLGMATAYARAAKTTSPIYNPKTEITITGTVQEVKQVPGPGRSLGTHLIVKTASDVYEVHAGPNWYLAQQNCSFKQNDQIEVTGSKVKLSGADVLIARQIKRGESAWTLRDSAGIPVWSRGNKMGR